MIDHKRKLVFIHLEKTGETSIEKLFTGCEWFHIQDKNSALYGNCDKFYNMKHLTYAVSKKFYSKYDDYKYFTVVRHPYDIFLSKFRWRKFPKNNIFAKDVEEMIKSNKKRWNIDNLHEFTGKSENYDFIIKFENFENDFKRMIKQFNIKESFQLKHSNSTKSRKDKYNLMDCAKERIQQYSKIYAEMYGYDF